MLQPEFTDRTHMLEDMGAIRDCIITGDLTAFGLVIAAHVRMRAIPGEVKRLAKMLIGTPIVIEADRVTGEDCFPAQIVVSDVHKLERVIERFLLFHPPIRPRFNPLLSFGGCPNYSTLGVVVASLTKPLEQTCTQTHANSFPMIPAPR